MQKDLFPVVGIGASAGGPQALQQFFAHMHADNGMAFVVILHLSPKYESQAAPILQNYTRMPVTQVTERVRVEPNQVYVIPPTKHLAMADGHIILTEPVHTFGRQVAIDLFFRTLADTRDSHAACVVLSGAGADGSLGLKRLKERGGITFAQEPREAEHDMMPRNAISTGMVDFVLPVARMPEKLIEVWRNAGRIRLPAATTAPVIEEGQQAEQALRDILAAVRVHTGHDFSHYRREMILRRLERRLQVTIQPDLPAYRDYLRENAKEAKQLLQDLLIGVTNFFRDRAAFDVFKREVVPQLFAGKGARDQIRVWTAGCSTGEEAYSVAMLLLEHRAALRSPPDIQVFATDIDQEAITTAREGRYSKAIETDVKPAYLRRFFTEEADGYRINKEVRERVLFAAHNLIENAPFSRLALITCRNLLIYLNRDVQEQIFKRFHFGLHPGGFLFLGNSESASSADNLFKLRDQKHRIFYANTVPRTLRTIPTLPLKGVEGADGKQVGPVKPTPQQHISFAELHQKLLEQYAPPSLIVNANYEILHLSDHAGRYVQFTGGDVSFNLLKVALPELRGELRTLLSQAVQTGRAAAFRRIRITREGGPSYVNLIARPIHNAEAGGTFVLVIFDEVAEARDTADQAQAADEPAHASFGLEADVQLLKQQLRENAEWCDTAVEELKTSNEELRPSSEELEMSKAELQSANEQMRAFNAELKERIDEAISVSDDLSNLTSATEIATIFLDRALRIKLFTPSALELFSLIPADEGRPLADITHRLAYDRLAADAEEVLDTLQRLEREITSHAGRTYLAHFTPYRATAAYIDGVVLTFVDITGRKRAEKAQAQLLQRVVTAQEDERRRVARELHDHVGQQLTALRLGIETFQGKPDAGRSELREMLRRLDETVDFLAWELHPAALDDLGLVVALSNFVEEWSKQFDVTAEFHTAGLADDRLAPAVEINLYRIVQEALNNVAKHARASHINVLLEKSGGQVRLIVEDDGVGFDPAEQARAGAAGGGLGLVGMRERAALIGGTLEVESSPGGGTTVFVRVPMAAH